MRKSIGRLSSSVIEALLPSAKADACTDSWCQTSGTKVRCCKICTSGTTTCQAWVTGNCTTHICYR
jgi:hypothetical protein